MKMKRDFLQDKTYIFMAEIIAILRESFWMWELQKEASQWYQMEMVLLYKYVPVFCIAILLSWDDWKEKDLRAAKLKYYIVIGCNIIIVLLNQVKFLLTNYSCIILVTAFCFGRVLFVNKKMKRKS